MASEVAPPATPNAASAAAAIDVRTAQPALRYLLVEDNPVFEGLLLRSIRRLGAQAEVSCCRTGAQALERVEDPEAHLDVALVDLNLPDIGGLEVISAVRRRFAEIPILVISAISAERSVLSAIRAGARGYILKSDSESIISAAIEQVIRGDYPISPGLARALFKLAGSPGGEGAERPVRLSERETETLRHIGRGLSYEEVARVMGVALSTVQSNVRSLYRKLDVHTQVQALNKARDAGLL